MAALENGWGYQGDKMNLPVPDVEAAVPFYESTLGFRVVARGGSPHEFAVLERDGVQMRLVENGGDSSQDGCAFHVKDLDGLLGEFVANGLKKQRSDIGVEDHDGVKWRVFYVVAPDGLCYWFGERETPAPSVS